jgi:hypothetical protein
LICPTFEPNGVVGVCRLDDHRRRRPAIVLDPVISGKRPIPASGRPSPLSTAPRGQDAARRTSSPRQAVRIAAGLVEGPLDAAEMVVEVSYLTRTACCDRSCISASERTSQRLRCGKTRPKRRVARHQSIARSIMRQGTLIRRLSRLASKSSIFPSAARSAVTVAVKSAGMLIHVVCLDLRSQSSSPYALAS